MTTTEHTIAPEIESCDCGGGYPCSHGRYVHGFTLDEAKPHAVARAEDRGEPVPDYAYSYDEVCEFPDWLLTRILLSGEMIDALEQFAAGNGDREQARRLLEQLDRNPVALDDERVYGSDSAVLG